MFDAQLLVAGSSVYSPWFSREADNLVVNIDVIQIAATNIKVEVYTKNSEDTGNGSPVSGSIIATSTGPKDSTWSGNLEEMVRYKFTVAGTSPDTVLFRMLSPVWYDAVNAV